MPTKKNKKNVFRKTVYKGTQGYREVRTGDRKDIHRTEIPSLFPEMEWLNDTIHNISFEYELLEEYEIIKVTKKYNSGFYKENRFYDTSTHLLEKIEGVSYKDNAGTAEIVRITRVNLTDYKKVSGISFPHTFAYTHIIGKPEVLDTMTGSQNSKLKDIQHKDDKTAGKLLLMGVARRTHQQAADQGSKSKAVTEISTTRTFTEIYINQGIGETDFK